MAREHQYDRLAKAIGQCGYRTRLSVVQHLVADPTPQGLPLLARMAVDPNLSVRVAVAKESADLPLPAALQVLKRSLGDANPAVVYAAITSLRTLTGKRMGYVPGRPLSDNREAISRWRRLAEGGQG